MEETKKNNDLGKKQSWDEAEDEIFSTTSKATLSSEKRVVKTLFGVESNSTSPQNFFDDDSFKKIDRDTPRMWIKRKLVPVKNIFSSVY